MDVVVTRQLSKCYGKHVALSALDFRVPAGRLFGFLGPNGAGKTTAIRILLGLLRPSAGYAQVLGHDAWRHGPRLRREVGYLPGDVRFYDGLTGRATLRFLDAARRSHAWTEAQRLAERLDLPLDRKVRAYSRGMKQKLGLIAALMHRPRLMILDEPTTGLDPLVRETVYNELRDAVRDRRSILFSSHTLAEVELLCDEVAILRNGRLIEQQRMETLRTRAVRRVELRLAPHTQPAQPFPTGLHVVQHDRDKLKATWTGPVDQLLEWLNRCPTVDVVIAPPDLDDLFLAYYTTQTDAEPAA